MTNPQDQSSTETGATAPQMGDPRFSFAAATHAVGQLMEATPASDTNNSTPCDDFTVKELMEHLVLVMKRVALIGEGGVWSTITEEPQQDGWVDSFRAAAHDVMKAWTDDAKLEQIFTAPWGEVPGGPMIWTYTGELAAHGWDLAQATGQEFHLEDDILQGALTAIKFIPAEGRDNPEIPFDHPVEVGPQASVLDQLVGWLGRSN